MIIEYHVIQNFAPSCLNRDDVNSPKECMFGGYRRARISSQCYKRAVRWSPYFQKSFGESSGLRTRMLLDTIASELEGNGHNKDDSRTVARNMILWALNLKFDKDKTKVAVYLGKDEITRIKEITASHFDTLLKAPDPTAKKIPTETKKLLDEISAMFKPQTTAADIALYGRMVAESKNFDIDAACQVSHAFSTHQVAPEMDFFTAVDDLQPSEDSGAGMMGTQDFNSATYYRYAALHMDQLLNNLNNNGELAGNAALAFTSAFIHAIPNAKQNSHAAHNPPSYVLITIRDGGLPLSLANAFVAPVHPDHNRDLITASVDAMVKFWNKHCNVYGINGLLKAISFGVTDPTEEKPDNTEQTNLNGTLEQLQQLLSRWQEEKSA